MLLEVSGSNRIGAYKKFCYTYSYIIFIKFLLIRDLFIS